MDPSKPVGSEESKPVAEWFVKKSIPIKSRQWFSGCIPSHPGVWCDQEGPDAGKPYVITAHGQRVYLAEGDWIVPESNRENMFYPIKPDIFAEFYEPVAAHAPQPVVATRDKGLLQEAFTMIGMLRSFIACGESTTKDDDAAIASLLDRLRITGAQPLSAPTNKMEDKMDTTIKFPSNTYRAKLVEVNCGGNASFKIAGTLDGFIDLATPSGTWPLSLQEARNLMAALDVSIADVEANCLHDRDVLLDKENRT